ncbi:MAG TPA: hypothetical protein VGW33_02730 [Terriglobia bacterium]|nr:hypothetical protein [Terriglobia bacterium]
MARDAVQADPKHYTLEFENDRVRVLRIRFGPREKSVLHAHPAGLAILLSDCDFRFYLPQGHTQDILGKVGQVLEFTEPFEHLPENRSGKAFEAIIVELKD